jgi:hypothetical protein
MGSRADLDSAEKKEFSPLQRIEPGLPNSSARIPVTVLTEKGQKLIKHGMTFAFYNCLL